MLFLVFRYKFAVCGQTIFSPGMRFCNVVLIATIEKKWQKYVVLEIPALLLVKIYKTPLKLHSKIDFELFPLSVFAGKFVCDFFVCFLIVTTNGGPLWSLIAFCNIAFLSVLNVVFTAVHLTAGTENRTLFTISRSRHHTIIRFVNATCIIYCRYCPEKRWGEKML